MRESLDRPASRWGGRALAALALGALPVAAFAAHPPVTLTDAAGNPIGAASTVPYSPEKTCGECHDVALIAQGYHFQQGRMEGTRLNVSDTFHGAKTAYDASDNCTKGTGAWWKLSDGMYGKH
jgi:hypothetical protein